MERELSSISGNPNDYKICKNCGVLNFHENESCINCNSTKFKQTGEGVQKYVKEDYEFFKQEGYKENKINNIKLNV